MDDRLEYYNVSERLKRKGLKTDENSSQSHSIFYEHYEGDIYFKVVYKRKGTGGESELTKAVRISKEEYDRK